MPAAAADRMPAAADHLSPLARSPTSPRAPPSPTKVGEGARRADEGGHFRIARRRDAGAMPAGARRSAAESTRQAPGAPTLITLPGASPAGGRSGNAAGVREAAASATPLAGDHLTPRTLLRPRPEHPSATESGGEVPGERIPLPAHPLLPRRWEKVPEGRMRAGISGSHGGETRARSMRALDARRPSPRGAPGAQPSSPCRELLPPAGEAGMRLGWVLVDHGDGSRNAMRVGWFCSVVRTRSFSRTMQRGSLSSARSIRSGSPIAPVLRCVFSRPVPGSQIERPGSYAP